VDGKSLVLSVENTTSEDCGPVSLGTYRIVDPNVPDATGQELHDQANHPNLKAGESATLRAGLPECGLWQGDGVQLASMPFRPAWSPGYHIGHERGDAGVCEPPKEECTPSRVDISVSQNEASAQSLTASVVGPSQSFSFTVNATNGATVIVNFGDGSPTESVTGPFPKSVSHTFALGASEKEYTVTATVAGGKYCAGKDTITVRVRKHECFDFAPAPQITGDIGVDTQPTVVNFSVGSVGPAGVTFANESLPASKPRPNFGQSAGSFSTTATLAYSPAEGLSCPREMSFTKPIPPREPTCEQANPPRFDNPSISVGNIVIAITQRVYNAGTWKGTLYAGTPNNPHQHDKARDTDVVACGGSDLLGSNDTLKYVHLGHPSCYWTYELTRNGVLQSGYPIVVLNRCR
jgi:hypothetical protein